MKHQQIVPGGDGAHYVPYEKRTGNESIAYFTRDLSPEGLQKIYKRVSGNIKGKVGIKLHTGEKNGPNIISREWVKHLVQEELPDVSIIETNTYYEGDRYTTEAHRETLKVNGWTFCPVDIMDEEGTAMLPVKDGKWFTEMSVGNHMLNYDSMVTLTHFKGHTMGGFGGSNKNIGIGCADGRIGKAMIHTAEGSDNMWSIAEEELMQSLQRQPSISLANRCEGCAAAPVVTPNIGIVASVDILAADQASVDLVYALKEEDHKDLVERMETRHGLRQLSYMKELQMGNDRYILIDIDNDDARICPKEAVKDVKPFEG